MADRKLLTDRFLKSLPPAPRGQRNEVWDSRVTGFGIRISDAVNADPARRGKAKKITFILRARFAKGTAPTRRPIGIFGAITLEEARTTAGEWRSLIAKGVDPAIVEAEAREKAGRERALRIRHSFAAVAETFIAEKLSRERRGKHCEHELRTVFVAAWGERTVGSITAVDVLEIINRKKTVASGSARCLLVLARRFFNWTIDQHVYGLGVSPCARLSNTRIIGPMVPRSRKLSDDELFAFWRATGRMRYPVGPVYRFLLLTGLRLNEAARLTWPEVRGDHAIIPAARMKGRDGYAREHLVPFSGAAAQVIASVPRIKGEQYVFSFDGGHRPMSMASKFKRELDRRMLRALRAMARRRGEDHHAVELPNWTNHDLRRVVRSGLSALRVPREVAEAVLAHAAPGIIGVYDAHEYEDEKREALELWAGRVKAIATPEPATPAADKIVTLPRRR